MQVRATQAAHPVVSIPPSSALTTSLAARRLLAGLMATTLEAAARRWTDWQLATPQVRVLVSMMAA